MTASRAKLLGDVVFYAVFIFVIAVLFIGPFVSHAQTPVVKPAALFCTTDTFSDATVCFKLDRVVLIVPTTKYLSFVSGDNFSLSAGDWDRLADFAAARGEEIPR